VIRENFETDDIEARASQRNQKVITLYKSSKDFILEVVCLSRIISKSSFVTHSPLSVIEINVFPPFSISTLI
jgi:hypothetical protein